MKPLTPKERLFTKIPELRPGAGFTAVHVNKFQLRRLSDDEFICLYYLPNTTVHVSRGAAKHIESRRRGLRLVRPNEIPPLPVEGGT